MRSSLSIAWTRLNGRCVREQVLDMVVVVTECSDNEATGQADSLNGVFGATPAFTNKRGEQGRWGGTLIFVKLVTVTYSANSSPSTLKLLVLSWPSSKVLSIQTSPPSPHLHLFPSTLSIDLQHLNLLHTGEASWIDGLLLVVSLKAIRHHLVAFQSRIPLVNHFILHDLDCLLLRFRFPAT